ncbi:sulfurtransferase TusA family protein [Alphaproteobacteria bacterium]|nr:sulfurtransferase TusA family protein [Alphaproteobacteria bacterium]
MEETTNKYIDVCKEKCPMSFVKVKLILENISSGDKLKIRFKGEETLKRLPKSIIDSGHKIIYLKKDLNLPEVYHLLIEHN